MTASSISWTPLFLKEDPHSTGVSLVERVARRIAVLQDLLVGTSFFSSRSSSSRLVVEVEHLLEQVFARDLRARFDKVGGDLHFELLFFAEVVLVDDRFHRHQIDHPQRSSASGADRQLDRHRMRGEAVDHRLPHRSRSRRRCGPSC